MNNISKLEKFLNFIKELDGSLKFEIIEIGAHPYSQKEEPFYKILEFFPNSRINAFDVDKDECIKLNKISKKGVKFFPYAIGEKREKRKFYETNHPMCSSLYEPDNQLLKLYNNFEMAYLKNISEIETISLDYFLEEQKIKAVDFIKIDIQGAELDVFRGAKNCLENVLSIVSEVEFVPIYKNQPLFGDICSFLKDKDIIFHKFLGLAGRTMVPVIFNNNKNFATQHFWSDAIFTKNVLNFKNFKNPQLLKMAVFSYLYGSPDLTYYCLSNYDKNNGKSVIELFKKI